LLQSTRVWIFANLLFISLSSTAAVATDDSIAQGKAIAFNQKKGNCLACHLIENGKFAGNLGPPLTNIKNRFPDRNQLRAQIFDAAKANANSVMPPFGRNQILTPQEIDQVVDFMYSLQ